MNTGIIIVEAKTGHKIAQEIIFCDAYNEANKTACVDRLVSFFTNPKATVFRIYKDREDSEFKTLKYDSAGLKKPHGGD